MEEIFKNLAENFAKLNNELPKLIKDVSKNITKKDAQLINKAMKESGYNKAMKDLANAQNKYNQFIKRHAR